MPEQDYSLKPGDALSIKAISPLYRETYSAEVISIQDRSLTISMPSHQGKLVLLGAGTPVEVCVKKHGISFYADIINRGFKPAPYLVLQIPYNLIPKAQNRPRVVTVTSGKGGVGKTTFTINFAIGLARLGQRVFIIDADLGTANVDVLLNLQPKYNLNHIINNEKELMDIVVEGPGGIYLVPGGSGLQNLANMEDWQFNRLISGLQDLEEYADIILIDTGAGLGKNVINFVLAADNIIVITTPEPHSITDAYAIIKVLDENKIQVSPHLLLNRVESIREYQEIYEKMSQVVNRFLSIRINSLGYILEDPVVPRANRRLQTFYLAYPDSAATRCINQIAKHFLHPEQEKGVAFRKSFFGKIKELFTR